MSPVQAAVLPLLPGLSQPYDPNTDQPRDLLVRAKTGTGKTLGFLIPAVEARIRALKQHGKEAAAAAGQPEDRHIEERAMRRMARADAGCLIISPTRELASQIATSGLDGRVLALTKTTVLLQREAGTESTSTGSRV